MEVRLLKIYIMRHGETDYNKRQTLQGHIDSHLNETGRSQARGAAEYIREKSLNFDRIYVSHLDRAQETAEIVSGRKRCDFFVDDRMIELDYGENIDGKCLTELDEATMAFLNDPIHVEPPEGVEKIPHLMERVRSFVKEIAREEKDEQILIVTHGETIRAFFACIDDLEVPGNEIWEMPIDNCDIFCVDCQNQKFSDPVRVRSAAAC